MELIDLLEYLHLDKVNDETLQKIAKGLSYELVIDPLEKEFRTRGILDTERKEQFRSVLNDSLIRGLKKAVEGSLPVKMGAALTVRRQSKRRSDLPAAEITDIDIRSLLSAADSMHIHHMSSGDYSRLANEISAILLDTGKTAELFTWNTPENSDSFRTIQTDTINKIYTGLKTALGHQDFLIQRAEESKQRAQNH